VKQSERLRRFVRNVLAIAYKEASLLRHDQTLFTSVLVLPVMMTVVMGLALSFRPQQIRWAVLDQSDDPVSRRLIGDLAADPAFLPPIHVTSQEAGREQLAAAHLNAFVVIPYDFRRALERGRAEVQVQLDGSDPILAARVGGYVSQIAANLGAAGNQGREPADLVRGTRSAPGSPVDLRQQFRFNPTLDDREFYLAALSGFVLTNLCLSFAALGLVAEKENGTYEQMLAQPTSPLEVIVGKLVPNVVAGYLGLSVSLVAAGLMYGFWPAGSVLVLFAGALPFMLATLGIGVFVSSVARDSAQAVFVAVFFLMPSFVLSGSLLPYELMPHGVREFGGLLPLRWYQIIARRVIDRGAGLTQVLVPIGVLLSIFAVMMLAIRARMKPRLG
jgi:ABC-2 type transport system permease protein